MWNHRLLRGQTIEPGERLGRRRWKLQAGMCEGSPFHVHRGIGRSYAGRRATELLSPSPSPAIDALQLVWDDGRVMIVLTTGDRDVSAFGSRVEMGADTVAWRTPGSGLG